MVQVCRIVAAISYSFIFQNIQLDVKEALIAVCAELVLVRCKGGTPNPQISTPTRNLDQTLYPKVWFREWRGEFREPGTQRICRLLPFRVVAAFFYEVFI